MEMAIYRVHKTKDFTTICNYHLKDKKLSLKGKGMLTLFLSLPDDWGYSVLGITAIVKESKNTVNGIMNELEELKYLKRKRVFKGNKLIRWEYDIYEKPYNLLHPNFEDIQNEDIRNKDIRNEAQLNTNKVKTKKEKTKEVKKINKKEYFEDKELNDLFMEYLEVRKSKKFVVTERAITLLLNKLNNKDIGEQKEMIENAIVGGWKSFYETQKETKGYGNIPKL